MNIQHARGTVGPGLRNEFLFSGARRCVCVRGEMRDEDGREKSIGAADAALLSPARQVSVNVCFSVREDAKRAVAASP